MVASTLLGVSYTLPTKLWQWVRGRVGAHTSVVNYASLFKVHVGSSGIVRYLFATSIPTHMSPNDLPFFPFLCFLHTCTPPSQHTVSAHHLLCQEDHIIVNVVVACKQSYKCTITCRHIPLLKPCKCICRMQMLVEFSAIASIHFLHHWIHLCRIGCPLGDILLAVMPDSYLRTAMNHGGPFLQPQTSSIWHVLLTCGASWPGRLCLCTVHFSRLRLAAFGFLG